MYTFFPPLTVLPHGKVLYLYPADRAAPAYGAHSHANRIAAPHMGRTSPPNAPPRTWAALLPCRTSRPAHGPHQSPSCGRRGRKYRGRIPFLRSFFAAKISANMTRKQIYVGKKTEQETNLFRIKCRRPYARKLQAVQTPETEKRTRPKPGPFMVFFVFPELMPEIFFPQGAPL